MGKYKPWDYIPNQSRYDNTFLALTRQNEIKQFAKLCDHNKKQMQRGRAKRK